MGRQTRARSDPAYDGKSYQKGGVWPFVTGWVAYSEFSHGNFKDGFLKTYQMTEMQRFSALSENQVIYHRGGRGGTQSFETVFSPLRDSSHSAVESKGMASSLEKSTVPDSPSCAGCFIQAWSATIYLYTIVRGFLGITPQAPESVTICPYLARDWNISVKRLASVKVYYHLS